MKKTWLGDVEHLEQFESFITLDDVGQLRDYFRIGGSSRFCKSPMAGMLERAELFAANLVPCVECGGVRIVNDGDVEQSGSGFVGGDFCPECSGVGWVNASNDTCTLTARPSMTAQHGSSHSFDLDVQIGTCAIVESILDKADVILPITTQVLSSMYGPSNNGTLSVWHVTPAGKKLLHRSSDSTVEPDAFYVSLRERNSLEKNKNTDELMKAADKASQEAIEYAGKAWNAARFVDRCFV
jgi:hypothetical protein